MMLINLDHLLPMIRELIPDLDEAQAAVNAEPDPVKRRELIDRYRPRWVALRVHMAGLSHNKCWYTESKNPGTDDDVDHYRPKNSVDVEQGEAPHGGYYWLAFVWRNFRLSCHRGNRPRKNPVTGVTGGKSDRFPLADPSKRLRTPITNQDELDKEEPLLLDPTKPRDVVVLTFTSDGYVAINPEFEDNILEQRRLEASRECYHLDWPQFKDDRIQLYNLVERKINRGKECAPPKEAAGVVRSPEFDRIVLELQGLMNRDQTYSAAARAFIVSFRSIWWVERYVLQIPPIPATHGGGPSGGPTSS
jgi:hypothetical protein